MKLRKYYPTIVLSDIHLFGMGISHYLNSGDWVGTLSALTEDEDGNWSVRYFDSMSMPDRELKEKETEQITIAS